jgi:hypothetical protein
MHERDDIKQRREHERRTLSVEAQIMDGRQWSDCRIANFSAGGAKLEVNRQMEPGTVVWLEIGKFGQFRATVVWQHGKETGVRFAHDPAEMAEVVIGLATYG